MWEVKSEFVEICLGENIGMKIGVMWWVYLYVKIIEFLEINLIVCCIIVWLFGDFVFFFVDLFEIMWRLLYIV